MMELSHSSASTPYVGPATPEPFASTAVEETRPPSPPRPRLRLKKRNVAHLSAPTQQFLASVAAADVPIPSIEEPEIASHDSDMTDLFPGMRHFAEEDSNFLSLRGRTFSAPKTPAPDVIPSLSPSRYPNWSIDSSFSSSAESTPDRDCLSSRPSTARSTRTNSSLFSHLSYSDDDHCESFDESIKPVVGSPEELGPRFPSQTSQQTCHQPRKAPWTKAMDAHLWSTYVLYLQDPKVTPFRLGKSCIPPHGVLTRVAREAKKSWKGAKAITKVSTSQAVETDATKSGSSTPTVESTGTFIAWPHTTSATRNHLRELCKLKASTPGARHGMSRSPTPFTQAACRHWNRRSTPRPASVFATRDMAMSLSMSTAPTMQPGGPLAQLTISSTESSVASASSALGDSAAPESSSADFAASDLRSFAERRRLGSPFSARSYGPSASTSLAAALGLNTSRQSHTIGPRRTLRSPVRMGRLTTTHKRRTKQSEESRKRPTLDSDVFTDPAIGTSQSGPSHRAGFSSTRSLRREELFGPRISVEPTLDSTAAASLLSPPHLMAPDVPPPRLGSPFTGTNTSFSFPNRCSQPTIFDLGSLGRPFATVQQSTEPAPAAPARTNLASRLAYIDQRLKEFNRGSQSDSSA